MKNIFEDKKQVSVGLILTNGSVFLSVSPTPCHGSHLDLPKGIKDGNEQPIETVLREVFEETGLHLNKYKSDMIDMGRFRFLSYKDLIVFVLKLDILPSLRSMKCISTFQYDEDTQLPEVDGYYYSSFKELNKFRPAMGIIINKIRDKLEQDGVI